MCRWIAYISPTEPCLLSDILITPPHGLMKQVSSHYLPYLIPHQISPIDVVDDITPKDEADNTPSASLAPTLKIRPKETDEEKRARDLKLRNLALNADGSGLAVYTASRSAFTDPNNQTPVLRPAVYKSIQPLTNDTNFRSLAENTETTCLLAHVRAGSGAPVATLNCHPFVFGRWSIMHNGSVAGIDAVRRTLLADLDADIYTEVKGGTDSEVIAALTMHGLTGGQGKETWDQPRSGDEIFTAVVGAIKAVLQTQRKLIKDMKPSSLNLCITDGTKLVATRFRNSEDEQPPSLYWSTKAGVTLNRKFPGHPDKAVDEKIRSSKVDARAEEEHGKHVIVASEPTTFKEEEWALIPKNTALVVDTEGKVELRAIEVVETSMSRHILKGLRLA